MPDKVLVYSRFPKAQLIRFGERYELLNAAGKRLDEAFPVAELADVSAMITAGGTPLRGDAMDMLPKLGAIVCYGTGYDGVDLAAQRLGVEIAIRGAHRIEGTVEHADDVSRFVADHA